jgi:hypothetical protein
MERSEILNLWAECLNGEVFEENIIQNEKINRVPIVNENRIIVGAKNKTNNEIIFSIEIGKQDFELFNNLVLAPDEEILFETPILLHLLKYHDVICKKNNITILFVEIKESLKTELLQLLEKTKIAIYNKEKKYGIYYTFGMCGGFYSLSDVVNPNPNGLILTPRSECILK